MKRFKQIDTNLNYPKWVLKLRKKFKNKTYVSRLP